MRKTVKILLSGLLIGMMCYAGLREHTGKRDKFSEHNIEKRQASENIIFKIENVPEEEEEEKDIRIEIVGKREGKEFEEFLPGYLVCKKRKETIGILPLGKLTAGLEETPDILNDVEFEGNRKASKVRISLASVSPTRPIGCCPPGDPAGQIYRVGSACCADEIYNTSSHFCCSSRSRIFKKTGENYDFCYPLDRKPYCRELDLEMTWKKPMKSKCQYTSPDKPTSCRMICPSGTQPKDDIRKVKCDENGVWNQIPTCCEGCPADFRLDLWFIVEVSQTYGRREIKQLKQFLKDLLSYMPVGQDRVRVGITIFNRVVFYDVGVWFMNEHDSHKSINRAIDDIPVEGSWTMTGSALSWVARNAFTKLKGNREDVENLVVAIVKNKSMNDVIEPARELKSTAKVIAVAIGDDVTDDEIYSIGSNQNTVYRSESFGKLAELKTVLYKSVCGEECILEKER